MSATQIAEIVRRALARQPRSTAVLSEQTRVPTERLLPFLRGEQPLSTAKLRRIATALELDAEALIRGEELSFIQPTLYFRRLGIFDFNEDDRPTLARCLERARAFSSVNLLLGRTSPIREALRPQAVGPVPYQDGYRAANTLRNILACPTEPIQDITAIFTEQLDTLIDIVPLRSTRVEAVTAKDLTTGTVLVVLNESRCDPARFPLGVRVTLAHELAHVLLDEGDEHGNYLNVDLARNEDLVTTLRDIPPIEARANAFHSEFLMPRPGLRALLGEPKQIYSPVRADELVDRVRQFFLTPPQLTVNHLANHKYIVNDDDLRHSLVQAANQRPTPALQATRVTGSDLLQARVREAHERLLITDGRARELLSLSPWDSLPWEYESR